MTVPAATLLALAAAGLAGAEARPPVFLTAVERSGQVVVQVRGLADAPFAGRYTLETVSGSNHATQSGSARLIPGREATFIVVSVSRSASWSAVLHVEPETGAPYEQRLGPSPAGDDGK